jgi:hypothetical protein
MNYVGWLNALDLAQQYASKNKHKLLGLDTKGATFEGVGFLVHDEIRDYVRGEHHSRDYINHKRCNLGHIYRKKAGQWQVCKHGAGWVNITAGEVPHEVRPA